MSLNSFSTSSHVPFFPPGIAVHKTMSGLKRPQNVKQCKKFSQNRCDKSAVGLKSAKRLSTSTPNIKDFVSSTNFVLQVPKHKCDDRLSENYMFKATPLPRYYSPDSLERNRSLFEQLNHNYKTQSLDRIAAKTYSLDRESIKSKSKARSNSASGRKPFYPPSKYPNIYDKGNVNLQRFLEAREQYKTPESRRSLKSEKCLEKNLRPTNLSRNKTNIGGSVPNLNSKDLKPNAKKTKRNKTITKKLNIMDNKLKNNKNLIDNSPEIGLYRQKDRLDLQDEFDFCIPKQMSTSYFYPKPSPSAFTNGYDDKMAQSLYNESSLAAKIHAGSLERASRDNFHQSNGNKVEVTDLDDSPSKSSSPVKQGNSFSQDSLDGNRRQPKNQNIPTPEQSESETVDSIIECEKSYNSNTEDTSVISESKTYKFSTLTEEDFNSRPDNQHKFLNSLSTISEKERTSEDQRNSILGDGNSNFHDNILNLSNPFIDHQNVNERDVKPDYGDYLTSDNAQNQSNFSENQNKIPEFDNKDFKKESSETDKKNTLLDQYNLDQYIMHETDITGIKFDNYPVGYSPFATYDLHDEKPVIKVNANDQYLLDEIASKCIVSTDQNFNSGSSFKKEQCVCVDNALIGESCFRCSTDPHDLPRPQDIDSTISTVYSSINTQVSGLDYDMPDLGCNSHLYNNRWGNNSELPRIEICSNVTKSVDESSESDPSLSGSDDLSYMEYDSVRLPHQGTSWVSSPELTIARSDIVGRRNIRHLQSENPLKPLCNVCYKPAYFMERISIDNIIFHKRCFLCRKCETHLSFNNCIIYHRKPYCWVHAKRKTWKPVRSASANKLSQIKERLDSKSNLQKQSSIEAKQPKRIFYGGIKSAKEKFLQEKETEQEPVARPQKRFTPPRQGVTAGIVESEPKPRDPNVITYDDNVNSFNEDINRLVQGNTTKEKLARFKEMQEKSFDKNQVNDSDGFQKPDVIPVDTKTLRNKFLSGVNDSNGDMKSRKINPSEEIQELARRESNTVFENEPAVRTDVIKSDQNCNDDENIAISRNKAKELKERFSNIASEDRSKRAEKFQMEIGEGGIYESNPQERNEDVIVHKSDKELNLPNNSVKAGLQKIRELQNIKSQEYQKVNNEPIKLDMDTTNSGIYENNPSESQADSIFHQNDEYLGNIKDKKYANDAKKAFLEKQRQEEETKVKRDTPQMIDIWKDLCPDSGIFENKPKDQDKDVLRHDDKQVEELAVQNERDS